MFEEFKKQQGYNEESLKCIKDCVRDLLAISSDGDKPGMLLGKIQSGKTRTFLGIIALAYDEGFDNVIVLTKGTNALAMQTVKRIEKDFAEFIKNDDVCVYDVMQAPELTEWAIEESKQLIVCKKEDDNLRRLDNHLFSSNDGLLGTKKTLIIDDEADFGTISMRKKQGSLQSGVLWDLVDGIRKRLKESAFLQVTATPYSLYLQPESSVISGYEFQPTRPAFTHLVPVHDRYIGGDFYFRESEDHNSVASDLHVLVDEAEMTCLSKRNKTKVKESNVLTAYAIKSFRESIANFVMAAAIRKIQTNSKEKYSFLIHVNTSKTGHSWQEEILQWLVSALKDKTNSLVAEELFNQAYHDLVVSIKKTIIEIPEYVDCLALSKKLLTGLSINKVNSEGDMDKLLDNQTGELKLLNPLSIFIGGYILDRGLTIPNVIGFFYGRSPKEFQQDTVLQHARMYGARTRDDLCVTRFYTTGHVFQIMKSIHEMDSALREALANGQQQQSIVFVQRDTVNRIKPCSPNKIMLSDIVALKAHSTRVPFGFQTGYPTNIKKYVEEIDQKLSEITDEPKTLLIEKAAEILSLIRKTFCFSAEEYQGNVPGSFNDEGCIWDVQSDIDTMYFANTSDTNSPNYGKVQVIVRRGRKRSRIRSTGRLENTPYTGEAEGELSKTLATDCCSIIFTRQNGEKDDGWMGTPFWWPAIRFPGNLKTMVYSPKDSK